MARFTFGPFLLDLESRALLRNGERVPLAGRTLDTLAVLLQNRGRLLDKDELLSRIWPGTVVDEANLSQSIFTLRKVLGDSRKDPRYIATIAGRGYQFVAPVTEITTGASQPADIPGNPQPETESRPAVVGRRTRRKRYVIAAGIVLVLEAAGMSWFLANRPVRAPSELIERRLTFNSSASEVASAVISPDGKYLAYSDPAGIHVRLLSTGEERLIAATSVASAGAFSWIDSWFPSGTELLGHSREAGGHSRMWAVSIMGQSVRELRAEAWGWSVSPDGMRIAFSPTTSDGYRPEIWVMDDRGENAHRVLGLPDGEFLWSVRWSPDGQRLAYIRAKPSRESLETCDLKGANRTAVRTVPGTGQWVRSASWLPDGRIVYSQAEAADVDANLWQVRVNPDGTPTGKPKRITRWAGVDVQGLTASTDGSRLVLRKETFPSQIYIGELEPAVRRVRPPQRLTNDEAVDWATTWTADSKAVLFTSDRGGKWGVFKQAIGDSTTQPLIEGRESANLARLSPDGSWILYSERASTEGNQSHGLRLMRLAVNGGPPKLLYESAGAQLQDYPCARNPANRCVLIEASLDDKRLLITAFDPLKGKGQLLRTVEKGRYAGLNWALSPDGSVLAIARGDQPEIHIRLLSLAGGMDREIDVKHWPNASSLDWSPDGKGLYCGSVTSKSGTLLYVDLKGTAQVVARSSEVGGGAFIVGVPSPDGRYLALTGAIHYSNAWLIEGF
jgi:DNA-binding winged helix-turn-helix (wHTH) protein/Tol biopolymer transport system component